MKTLLIYTAAPLPVGPIVRADMKSKNGQPNKLYSSLIGHCCQLADHAHIRFGLTYGLGPQPKPDTITSTPANRQHSWAR